MTTETRDNPPPASERLRSLPEPPTEGIREVAARARRDRLFLILAALAISLGSIGFAVALGSQNEAQLRSQHNADAAARADARASAAGTQADVATKAAEEANRRLRALGKPTVPIPTVTISQPPVEIPDGLTEQQTIAVRGIIADELVRAHPNLTPAQVQQISRVAASLVPKPKDGKTPTTAQLVPLAQAAQRAYCADGRCTPKPGKPGEPGAQGSPGTAGKDAPPVTDEQLRPLIASELATYCAQDSHPCKGDNGIDGVNGTDGRSVVDTDCVGEGDDSHWVIYYDRPLPGGATTQVRMGPCRLAPVLPSVAARTK